MTQPLCRSRCRIERGVVFRQTWIATVAEDALHKVEITDEAAGAKSALHRFLGDEALHGGHTTGRSSSETKHSAWAGCDAVKGSRINSGGG